MEAGGTEVIVLRLGHRPGRDKRVTSHVALTARALGASGFILAGLCDEGVSKTISETEYYWGRGLRVSLCGLGYRTAINLLKKYNYKIVHLTMYGLPLDEVMPLLKKEKKIAVVVGAEKTPAAVYELADYNVSIGNQPHSEVAALAVFLDRLYNGVQLYRKYEYAKINITPSPRGKTLQYNY